MTTTKFTSLLFFFSFPVNLNQNVVPNLKQIPLNATKCLVTGFVIMFLCIFSDKVLQLLLCLEVDKVLRFGAQK